MTDQRVAKKKTVDFQGSIEVVTIDGIFQLIFYANISGKMILLNPPGKASFYFSNGLLIWGTLHNQQKPLGQLLLERNMITPQQLNEGLILHNQKKHQTRLGNILINKGFLQLEDLSKSLKKQIKDAFFTVLDWNSGTFAFISDMNSPEQEIRLNERIDHLLLEGVVHLDKNERANKKLLAI